MADISAQQLRKLQLMGVRVWQDRTRRPLPTVLASKSRSVVSDESTHAPQINSPAPLGAPKPPGTFDDERNAPPAAPSRPAAPPPDVSQHDWQMLRAAVSSCTLCALSDTRSKTVFGVGAEKTDLMIIGEAPGAEEDRKGEPFVGRAGQLLDAMLASISRSRENVFIANVLKCRPPGNRDPHTEEAHACSGYLNRQIELVKPKAILAVGRISAQRLLGNTASLARMRGKLHHYGNDQIPLVVTYHPAYLLRSPGQKRKAWEDLMSVYEVLSPSSKQGNSQ